MLQSYYNQSVSLFTINEYKILKKLLKGSNRRHLKILDCNYVLENLIIMFKIMVEAILFLLYKRMKMGINSVFMLLTLILQYLDLMLDAMFEQVQISWELSVSQVHLLLMLIVILDLVLGIKNLLFNSDLMLLSDDQIRLQSIQ